MGRNGSGKSTLLHTLSGTRRPTRGSIVVDGRDPQSFRAAELVRQRRAGPAGAGAASLRRERPGRVPNRGQSVVPAGGTTPARSSGCCPASPTDRHPRDLSEGQRLALALALVVAPAPTLLLLDEPTRGLDYPSKERLIRGPARPGRAGHAIVLATHDVELAARVADRAVVLADGQIITDGPARQVVCHSPIFAPQVAKVLAPEEWLTVDEVRRALAETVPRMTVSVPSRRASAGGSAAPGHPIRLPLRLPVAVDHGVRHGRLRLAPLDPSIRRPNTAHNGDAPWIFVGLLPLLLAIVDGRALRRGHRCQGGGVARHPRRVLRGAAGA